MSTVAPLVASNPEIGVPGGYLPDFSNTVTDYVAKDNSTHTTMPTTRVKFGDFVVAQSKQPTTNEAGNRIEVCLPYKKSNVDNATTVSDVLGVALITRVRYEIGEDGFNTANTITPVMSNGVAYVRAASKFDTNTNNGTFLVIDELVAGDETVGKLVSTASGDKTIDVSSIVRVLSSADKGGLIKVKLRIL